MKKKNYCVNVNLQSANESISCELDIMKMQGPLQFVKLPLLNLRYVSLIKVRAFPLGPTINISIIIDCYQ